MNFQNELLAKTGDSFLYGVMILLCIMAMLCLIRSIKGPKVADRLVAVNMIGTIVMVMVGVLTIKMSEAYLADVCLIYAMISFLAVIILSKIYMGQSAKERDIKARETLEASQKEEEAEEI